MLILCCIVNVLNMYLNIKYIYRLKKEKGGIAKFQEKSLVLLYFLKVYL